MKKKTIKVKNLVLKDEIKKKLQNFYYIIKNIIIDLSSIQY
jgi:hypothetical protein